MAQAIRVVTILKKREKIVKEELLIPVKDIDKKKFNCDSRGIPVNKEALDRLGIRYVCS